MTLIDQHKAEILKAGHFANKAANEIFDLHGLPFDGGDFANAILEVELVGSDVAAARFGDSLTLMIVGLVVWVKTLEQPWRGIVDAGVLFGLGWSLVSI